MESGPAVLRGTIRQPALPQVHKRIRGPRYSQMPDISLSSVQIEQPSVFDRCIRMLEDCNSPIVERIRYLGCGDDEDIRISDGSLEMFTGILCRTRWTPPTSIGLDDNGLISASWQNHHADYADDEPRCPGMATMLFPEPDGQFQLTAMFGDANSGSPWIQVVGNLNEQDALAFLDQIISGFYK